MSILETALTAPMVWGGGSGGSLRAYDADALSWKSAVEANGGSVSLARLVIVDQFLFNEKAAGCWAETDDYWPFWGENAIQAMTSLKQRRLATAVNSPVFTADRDFTFDGAASYIDTGFIAATHGIKCTGTNQRLAAYERTNVASNNGTAAVLTASNNGMYICSRAAAGNVASCRFNSTSVPTFTISPQDSRGLKAGSRAGGTNTYLMYDRGVRLTDVTVGSPSTSTPTHSLMAGALNNAGVATSFRPASLGFLIVGGPLSDAQEAAQYANVQAWATSVGAQV